MKTVVTGGSGFTGSYVVRELLRNHHDVRCLVRGSSDLTVLPLDRLEITVGDLGDSRSLEQAFAGCDALVSVASLGFGHAPAIVRAARSCGVRRAVFFSSTSLFTLLNVESKSVRREAEETIFDSGLDFTLLRPTMIYGSSRDRNICRLIRFLARWPVIPIPGKGSSYLQPVYVEDLAEAVVRCLKASRTTGKAYNLSGAEPITFAETITTICSLLGRRVRRISIPHRPAVWVLELLEALRIRFPVTAEQLLRLNEDKAFSHQAAMIDFGYEPLSFEEGLRFELREMGLLPSPS